MDAIPHARPFPAHHQAHGHLVRAIVSLPTSMCQRDRPLQERWVFFDSPTGADHGARLVQLLALAWNTDTSDWRERGFIYNVDEARELIAQSEASDDTALFECGWGSGGAQHVSPEDVEFFVTPAVRTRLLAALAQVHGGMAIKGAAA